MLSAKTSDKESKAHGKSGKMTAYERLQNLRNDISQLRYVVEKARHMTQMDDIPEITHFFNELRSSLEEIDVRKTHNASGNPSELHEIRQSAVEFFNRAKQIEQTVVNHTLSPKNSMYENLSLNLLKEAESKLKDINLLLSDKWKGLSTRVNEQLLRDQVSHFINEFDALFDMRIPQYMRECLFQGQTFTVRSSNIIPLEGKAAGTRTDGTPSYAMVTFNVVDFVCGVHPARVAAIVIQQVSKYASTVRQRITDARAAAVNCTFDASVEALHTLSGNDVAEYDRMIEFIARKVGELRALKEEWERKENDFFQRIVGLCRNDQYSGIDALKKVADFAAWKRTEEEGCACRAAEIHDFISTECLPFVSPQYYRRNKLTYSNPCYMRLTMRIQDTEAGESPFTVLPTLCPEYFECFEKLRHVALAYGQDLSPLGDISYLFPHSHEMWLGPEICGEFPEMVMGRRCVLRNATRRDLERGLEEHKECGGYFVVNGNERILRTLLVQRTNVALNVARDSYARLDSTFTKKAVLMSCKRACGLTTPNYFYYSTIGQIIFSFTRKVAWNIPATLLLFALKPGLTATTLYNMLTVYSGCSAAHSARVEAILQNHRNSAYGKLTHFMDFISVIGALYRSYQQDLTNAAVRFLPDIYSGVIENSKVNIQGHQDAWYGLYVLRTHLFPHQNADVPMPELPLHANGGQIPPSWPGAEIMTELEGKFNTLVSVCRQLLAFNDDVISDQGNDTPAYQEVLTASQVLLAVLQTCLLRSMTDPKASPIMRFAQLCTPSAISSLCRNFRKGKTSAERMHEPLQQLHASFSNMTEERKVKAPLLTPLMVLMRTGNYESTREEDFTQLQPSGWMVSADHINFFRFFEIMKVLHRGKAIADMRASSVRKFPKDAFGFICMVHSPDGRDCGVVNHMTISAIVSSACVLRPQQVCAPSAEEPSGVCLPVPTLSGLEHVESKQKVHALLLECMPQLLRIGEVPLVDLFLDTVPVWVEGSILGYLRAPDAAQLEETLRVRKSVFHADCVTASGLIPRDEVSVLNTLEVVFVPPVKDMCQSRTCERREPPGLYIFWDNGRLMRPVLRLETPGAGGPTSSTLMPFPITFIGTWEQTRLDIASVPSDLADAYRQLSSRRAQWRYKYIEQSGSNLISLTSTLIPFFEHNCSPRNLFQCGLSKQTCGTQMESLAWSKEPKLYRIYTPQRYIVRTEPMDYFGLDNVSLGVNATIAILAYTGYDMDDAVIVNDTAVRRGMLNAGLTIGKIVKLSEKHHGAKGPTLVFRNQNCPDLRSNGLPRPRALPQALSFTSDSQAPQLRDDTPIYSYCERIEERGQQHEYRNFKVVPWKALDKGEDAWVHNVIPLEYDGPDVVTALFVFRIRRDPNVGDKFSSRHGQKGTLPLHINSVDLPFSAVTGITPDVLINPHAFPSRMTVGMVLEIMAGKLGALQGRFQDFSAWTRVDAKTPIAAEEIGDALQSHGFQRYGREVFICGISGAEIEAEVFTGVCGYQRLKHQVSDKYQARGRTDATHGIVTKTGQPVKGRKKHGGVRVGEMERDCLVSHGATEVVIDRLLNSSDKTKAFLCSKCGSIVSIYEKESIASNYNTKITQKACRVCGAEDTKGETVIDMIDVPQVYKLLVAELTSVGIRTTLKAE